MPVGIESFAEIRRAGCYYVDKTGLITALRGNMADKVVLFTRPRRFGKTLMLDTLAEFFDITKESKALFAGLEVSENQAFCDEWMNQYPVIFLTLKEVGGDTFEDALLNLDKLILRFCRRHEYLLEGEKLSHSRKQAFRAFMTDTISPHKYTDCLTLLTEVLCAYWGKPAILLIDEYDVPLDSARKHGYLDSMMPLIRKMLSSALKTNYDLKFAVLTGCLRISRESLFTGLNNFTCFTVSNNRFSDKFGFTPEEVQKLLETVGLTDHMPEIQAWYDGYRFGDNQEIYCPWDVLQHVSALRDSPSAKPQKYWKNTSSNEIINEFLDMPQTDIHEKVEQLLSGDCIAVEISEEMTYKNLYSSENNLWSILYLTGYLTKASPAQVKLKSNWDSEGKTWLTIPNREIMSIFPEIIKERFARQVKDMDRRPLFKAFWDGDSVSFSKQLSDILLETISYYDYDEKFYHAFLAGIFSGAGFNVTSNREAGTGRPDIMILDNRNRQAAIIEVKHADSYEDMEREVSDAFVQIEDRRYGVGIDSRFKKLLLWGVAFHKKDAVAQLRQAIR